MKNGNSGNNPRNRRALARGLVVLILGGCAPAVVLADGSGQWKSGKEAYEKVCAYCHEKGVGPAIRGRGAPPDYRIIVRYGRRAMPQFRAAEISDEILGQLMEYIK